MSPTYVEDSALVRLLREQFQVWEQRAGGDKQPFDHFVAGAVDGMLTALADAGWSFMALVPGVPLRARELRDFVETRYRELALRPLDAPQAEQSLGRLEHTTVAMTPEQAAAAQTRAAATAWDGDVEPD